MFIVVVYFIYSTIDSFHDWKLFQDNIGRSLYSCGDSLTRMYHKRILSLVNTEISESKS
jgi:hypothetical protein